MKFTILSFLAIVITSCSSDKLPKDFIGTYVDVENPNRTITIENVDGSFIEKDGNSICTGKFLFTDMSAESKETFFRITGFELGESNFPDGVHLIGSIDYSVSSSWSAFKEGEWPQFGKSKKTQAIKFGEGVYGGLGPLYLKR